MPSAVAPALSRKDMHRQRIGSSDRWGTGVLLYRCRPDTAASTVLQILKEASLLSKANPVREQMLQPGDEFEVAEEFVARRVSCSCAWLMTGAGCLFKTLSTCSSVCSSDAVLVRGAPYSMHSMYSKYSHDAKHWCRACRGLVSAPEVARVSPAILVALRQSSTAVLQNQL